MQPQSHDANETIPIEAGHAATGCNDAVDGVGVVATCSGAGMVAVVEVEALGDADTLVVIPSSRVRSRAASVTASSHSPLPPRRDAAADDDEGGGADGGIATCCGLSIVADVARHRSLPPTLVLTSADAVPEGGAVVPYDVLETIAGALPSAVAVHASLQGTSAPVPILVPREAAGEWRHDGDDGSSGVTFSSRSGRYGYTDVIYSRLYFPPWAILVSGMALVACHLLVLVTSLVGTCFGLLYYTSLKPSVEALASREVLGFRLQLLGTTLLLLVPTFYFATFRYCQRAYLEDVADAEPLFVYVPTEWVESVARRRPRGPRRHRATEVVIVEDLPSGRDEEALSRPDEPVDGLVGGSPATQDMPVAATDVEPCDALLASVPSGSGYGTAAPPIPAPAPAPPPSPPSQRESPCRNAQSSPSSADGMEPPRVRTVTSPDDTAVLGTPNPPQPGAVAAAVAPTTTREGRVDMPTEPRRPRRACDVATPSAERSPSINAEQKKEMPKLAPTPSPNATAAVPLASPPGSPEKQSVYFSLYSAFATSPPPTASPSTSTSRLCGMMGYVLFLCAVGVVTCALVGLASVSFKNVQRQLPARWAAAVRSGAESTDASGSQRASAAFSRLVVVADPAPAAAGPHDAEAVAVDLCTAVQLPRRCSGWQTLCDQDSYATPAEAAAANCPYCPMSQAKIASFTQTCGADLTQKLGAFADLCHWLVVVQALLLAMHLLSTLLIIGRRA